MCLTDTSKDCALGDAEDMVQAVETGDARPMFYVTATGGLRVHAGASPNMGG